MSALDRRRAAAAAALTNIELGDQLVNMVEASEWTLAMREPVLMQAARRLHNMGAGYPLGSAQNPYPEPPEVHEALRAAAREAVAYIQILTALLAERDATIAELRKGGAS